jgi:hypothetical protein
MPTHLASFPHMRVAPPNTCSGCGAAPPEHQEFVNINECKPVIFAVVCSHAVVIDGHLWTLHWLSFEGQHISINKVLQLCSHLFWHSVRIFSQVEMFDSKPPAAAQCSVLLCQYGTVCSLAADHMRFECALRAPLLYSRGLCARVQQRAYL